MRWFSLDRHPGRSQRLWPVLGLLALAVLLPAAGVLWFMDKAVENESLAGRQKLEEIHRHRLAAIRDQLAADWRQRAADLGDHPAGTPPAGVFARVLETTAADAAVVLDQGGRPAYPAAPVPPPRPPGHPSAAWHEAERLAGQDPEAAAAAWARLAGEAADPHLAGRAFQARIRTLLRLGRQEEAVALLLDDLGRERFAAARDARGRLIAPNALLLALRLLDDPASDEFRLLARRLHRRLSSYAEPALAAPQRRFLMGQLSRLVDDLEPFPTAEAEELAARFVDSEPELGEISAAGPVLAPSSLPGLWRLPSPNRRVIALYRQQTLEQELATWVAYFAVPGQTSLAFLPASAPPDARDPPLVSLPTEDPISGWRLELSLDRDNFARLAAARQIRAYRWTAALVVGLILLLSLLAAAMLRHQLRLAALKNDLLSTVSHELKTPLASMRLLIDTLLDGGREEPQRVKEYLEIMAAENRRLSHLVENFLAFSRLSHGRQRFQRDELDPEDVATEAVAAAGERLTEPGCHFEMEADPDLPVLVGDRDALATAVLNLLDNALKYTGEEKHIGLSTSAENGHLCFAVSDDGVGLSPREAARVFDRFYQADRRRGGGCGLGLSIVELIARAHGGEVAVESRRGRGSTFTLRLPAGELGEGAP